MAYPTTYSWSVVPAGPTGDVPQMSSGPVGTPSRKRDDPRGIKFANVRDGKATNVVHGGPRVYHVNAVMTVAHRPSDQYYGDEPSLQSGVISHRGNLVRMRRVPARVRGQSPTFLVGG